MVMQLGMADELGPEYFGGADNGLDGQGYAPWEPKEYSDETAKRIDDAVARLIDDAHQRARNVLTTHRDRLDAVAAALLREESLDGEQLAAIVNAPQPAEAGASKASGAS
jgi:cell division protease FtsH